MWFFNIPRKIVFGEDSLEELDELKGEKALVVTDKILINLGITQKVIDRLKKNNFTVVTFDKVSHEPSIPLATEGAEIAVEHQVDWIIAVGGGSVIDCAKAIWILYENPKIDIVSVFPEDPLSLRKKARLVTIPTTSGTGSDANWAIILKDPETKQKISVAHRSLIPDIDILDPSLTLELPAKLTASTGIDALTHAIEAYTVEWKNDFSDAMAIQAIKLLFEGIAFGNSQIGGAHSLAHSAGAVLNIPHGEIISLTLPFMMRYCVEEPRVVKYYSEIAKELDISFQSPEEGAEKLIQEVEKLIKNLGLKTTLKEFAITKEILDKNMDLLADFALNDTGSLVNPRELSNESIRELYYSMLGE